MKYAIIPVFAIALYVATAQTVMRFKHPHLIETQLLMNTHRAVLWMPPVNYGNEP